MKLNCLFTTKLVINLVNYSLRVRIFPFFFEHILHTRLRSPFPSTILRILLVKYYSLTSFFSEFLPRLVLLTIKMREELPTNYVRWRSLTGSGASYASWIHQLSLSFEFSSQNTNHHKEIPETGVPSGGQIHTVDSSSSRRGCQWVHKIYHKNATNFLPKKFVDNKIFWHLWTLIVCLWIVNSSVYQPSTCTWLIPVSCGRSIFLWTRSFHTM